LGKIGTDIENAKLSWLCVQALQRMTPEQREIFEANYGFDDAEKVAIIKQMYETLGMKDIYNTQEDESLKRVYGLIEKYNQLLVPSWFDQVIAMVHNRQK